jgi:hypothetical protein
MFNATYEREMRNECEIERYIYIYIEREREGKDQKKENRDGRE